MNKISFQKLVRGCHGRKIAYTDVEKITADNVVKVIGDCIGTFNYNKTVIEYLWNYYKGDQPVLYRVKVSNEDITNRVVENHAFEWVQFKVAQTFGEPIQFVSRKNDEAVNKAVDLLNDYFVDANKHEKDIKAGEWQSATGTSFKAIQIVDGDVPIYPCCCTNTDEYFCYLQQEYRGTYSCGTGVKGRKRRMVQTLLHGNT